jgi:hypothetical protein
MEQWKSLVRREGLPPRVAEGVFRTLSRMRIKDKGKFTQRMGPEFEAFTETLNEQYPEDDVQTVLRNDEFFTLTLEVQAKYKR